MRQTKSDRPLFSECLLQSLQERFCHLVNSSNTIRSSLTLKVFKTSWLDEVTVASAIGALFPLLDLTFPQNGQWKVLNWDVRLSPNTIVSIV